jgi:GrpB-like predicted nucleotidyltransferase (UPF0157 family)
MAPVGIPVVTYDPGWAEWFEAERAELARALSPWLSGGIHHIGSTAVPGLAAKPILDIMAGVRDLTEAAQAVPVLSGLAYAHADHRPDALWFYKPASAGPRDVAHACHLHLTEPGSSLWRERLAFRDALRADPQLARQYQDLKRQLGRSAGDLSQYTAGKRDFVAAVLARSGVELPAAREPSRPQHGPAGRPDRA